MVMHRKVIVHPGVTIEYSGPESVVERLNSSRPIAIDLILEAGSVYILQLRLLAKSSYSGDVTPLNQQYGIPGIIRRKCLSAANHVRVYCTEENPKQLHVAAQRLVYLQPDVSRYEVSQGRM